MKLSQFYRPKVNCVCNGTESVSFLESKGLFLHNSSETLNITSG